MVSHVDVFTLDGSHGEGGGQIVRTALAIAAITGRRMRIVNMRAGRPKPGLAAQHLTAIRALAAICRAEVTGDALGSQTLDFAPRAPVTGGRYRIDVAQARKGGSAGAACLVLQSLLVPLALSGQAATVTVHGGTHVPWSPSFDYLHDAWLDLTARLGLELSLKLVRTGWYPAGGGEIVAEVGAVARSALKPLDLVARGRLLDISGRALTANLVGHIATRMADRAHNVLACLGVPVHLRQDRLEAASPGAAISLNAHYENVVCGFGAIGRRGKPAEDVATEAADALLGHHRGGAACDKHLADQILLPLAFGPAPSRFGCAQVTRHLETNAWVIEEFGLARIAINRNVDGTAVVTVEPTNGQGLRRTPFARG